MTDSRYVLDLSEAEHSLLVTLLSDYIDLLSAPDLDDPAQQRLSPDAYRDDPQASQEFRRLVHGDANDRRVSDAADMLESLTESEAPTVDGAQADAWIKTLAGIRLVLASRLGIDDQDDRDVDDDDPTFYVYDWLGYRLEHLVMGTEHL